jgi:hypothetical protein
MTSEIKRDNIDVQHARIIWSLYQKHGVGEYNNWLTLRKDRLPRESVVEALTFDVVAMQARAAVESHKASIVEIESLLAEASKPEVTLPQGDVVLQAVLSQQDSPPNTDKEDAEQWRALQRAIVAGMEADRAKPCTIWDPRNMSQ